LELLKAEKAEECHQNLMKFLADETATIIPISAMCGDNIDYVIRDLLNNEALNRPKFLEKTRGPARLNIVRSYDINKPSTKLNDLQGAVVGGTLISGLLTVGDYIEIRPGVIYVVDGVKHVRPLYAKVTDLRSEETVMKIAAPGGLIGVGLSLYAGLSGGNRLAGQVAGHPGTLPDMYDGLFGTFSMIDATVKLSEGQTVQIVANGVMIVSADIVRIKKTKIEFKSHSPLVLDKNTKCAIMLTNKLVAHFNFLDGDLSLPIMDHKDFRFTPKVYDIVDDLQCTHVDLPSYADMAGKITYRTTKTLKIELYIPQLKPINKSSYISKDQWDMLIVSLTHTAADPSVDLSEIIRSNMENEFSNSKPRFDQQGSLLVDFRMNSGQLTGFLTKLQTVLMQCPSCRSTRTVLQKDHKRVCQNCMSSTHVMSFIL
jgi:hypothetical protein